MKAPVPNGIISALNERRRSGALRTLIPHSSGVDLCSNDYLGLARILQTGATGTGGATGSRLVSGNSNMHEELEHFLAAFHGAEGALLFGSGYEANLGLLGSLGKRTDTIIYDELIHASMRDGARLSPARSFSFRHNDPLDLRTKIANARGEVYVTVESLYSMDGDRAPLSEILSVCEEKGAFLLVDEAHATGVYGAHGEGIVQEQGLEDRVFARVHTFGKALGYRGAVVVGSEPLRSYLINFARSFIYSTAPDTATLETIRRAYELQASMTEERTQLKERITFFRDCAKSYPHLRFLESDSPIQGIILPGNDTVLRTEEKLASCGFFARAIRSPTVPIGQERLRLCLHAFNTHREIADALEIVASSQPREHLSHVV
jgi:8-amino-7-oxononanoate synthase